MIAYLIIAAVIVLDRVVKYTVSSNMNPGETIPIVNNVFHITYVQNQGAAFSLMQGKGVILIALPVVVIAAALVIIFLKQKSWNKVFLTAVALICGGGLGNLIDRIAAGYVVDMFDFRVFPVFNVADIAICVGCGILLLDVIFLERKRSNDEH